MANQLQFQPKPTPTMLLHCHNLSFKTTTLHALPCINHSKPNLNPNIITYKFHVSGHRRVLSPVRATKDDGDGEEGRYQAKEALARLNAAINNKSLSELGEVIRDEFSFMSLLIPIFHSLQEKQMFWLLSSLYGLLAKHIEFVIQPTNNGMNVGVTWLLTWNKSYKPRGKGYSFDTSHLYEGRVLIRNFEKFVGEPLNHIEALKLKLMEIAMSISEKFNLHRDNDKARVSLVYLLLFLLTMAISFTLWKHFII